MNSYDFRHLPCPQPVIETKKLLNQGQFPFTVIVQGEAPLSNLKRMLTTLNVTFDITDHDHESHFVIHHMNHTTPSTTLEQEIECSLVLQHKVFLFTKDFIGGDESLGEKLIIGFLKTLTTMPSKPHYLIFINSAVKLTTLNTESINLLLMLENQGVIISSCGLCLEHYALTNSLKVGIIGNALETLTLLTHYETVTF